MTYNQYMNKKDKIELKYVLHIDSVLSQLKLKDEYIIDSHEQRIEALEEQLQDCIEQQTWHL